jgi:hypothetical protein
MFAILLMVCKGQQRKRADLRSNCGFCGISTQSDARRGGEGFFSAGDPFLLSIAAVAAAEVNANLFLLLQIEHFSQGINLCRDIQVHECSVAWFSIFRLTVWLDIV